MRGILLFSLLISLQAFADTPIADTSIAKEYDKSFKPVTVTESIDTNVGDEVAYIPTLQAPRIPSSDQHESYEPRNKMPITYFLIAFFSIAYLLLPRSKV